MNTSEPCAMRRRLCLAAPALLGAGVLAGCGGHPAKAPYSTFSLLDGSTLYSSAFVNKVALVNFWATTCSYCLSETPQLAALYNSHHARGLEVVAVALASDRAERLARVAQSRQLPYPVAHDRDGSIARQWGGIRVTPTAFVVDRQGRIARRFMGARLHDVTALIDQLMA